MGKRGPKARPGRAGAEPSRPYAPRGLDEAAKGAWDRLCDDLEAAGNLDRTDRNLIEIYAQTYSHWGRVDAELSAQSLPMPPPSSQATGAVPGAPAEERPYPFRLANLHLSLSARLRQILLDLGLSPSTRKPRDAAAGGPWLALMGGEGQGGL